MLPVSGLSFVYLGQSFVDLALFLARIDGVLVQDGNASAVVATIFKSLQTFDDDGGSLLFTNVTNDAAHRRR